MECSLTPLLYMSKEYDTTGNHVVMQLVKFSNTQINIVTDILQQDLYWY